MSEESYGGYREIGVGWELRVRGILVFGADGVMVRKCCLGLGVGCLFGSLSALVHGQSYTITNLDVKAAPAGFEESAFNNEDQIVGWAPSSLSFEGYLDNGGEFTYLNNTSEPECIPTAINDSGQIVGRVDYGNNSTATPFLYSGGTMTLLPTPSGIVGVAGDINDSGQIVGYTQNTTTGAYRAFLDTGGTMYDLNSLATSSDLTLNDAYGLNGSGEIVGYGTNASGDEHAFVYDNGVVTDLGTFGGENSSAMAINNAGQVIGIAQTAGDAEWDLFLYSNGQMTDLGPRGGDGWAAINNEGQVIAETANGYILYSNGTSINLTSLLSADHWNPYFGLGINDSGQIIGWGDGPEGNNSYLLTPVPEPATFSVFAMCAAELVRRRRS
jgi:probable HAF family extracellular repeat protein